MRSRLVLSLFIGIGLLSAWPSTGQTVSTKTLLMEMADLAGLAEFPAPAYTCKQFSSYDPASKTPDDAKTWFANNDCGQYLRVQERAGRKENVMADMDGPGAIVRIWSANPKGTLRIYLDGAEKPALEVPMADFLGGKVPNIPDPIACTRSAGWNSYFPIPYAKHCQVTSDEGGFYYHVNYRTYAAGTKVETFDTAQLPALAAGIKDVAARLMSPQTTGGATEPLAKALPGAKPDESWELAPGQARSWSATATSPAALDGFRIKVEAPDLTQALRAILLTAEFDGERTVACPLGDFFGAGPGLNAYDSLPLGATKDGELWCRWVMPFQKSTKWEFRNTGTAPGRVMARFLQRGSYKWTERSMYFHASWRVARDVPTRPMQDWNYLTAKGQGTFVGAAFAIANPVKQWWGEGDEKIYVDGETFPSHFGTGTEDYYCYAWGSPVVYAHAYHSQPRCDGPANYGHTAVNRWHIMDRIPYAKDFRFDMELWHWWEGNLPEISVLTYWYARPGATSNRAAPEPADLKVAVLPPYTPPRVKGALEGEELKILEKTGEPGPQGVEPCSNEQHLWWREAKPGDKLVVAFEAPKAGRYRVLGRFVKARDYGIVQLSVNDKKAGGPLDFYNDGVIVSPEMPLGEFDLKAGANRFTAEIVGANEKAVKAYMFGLDYLRLEPAE